MEEQKETVHKRRVRYKGKYPKKFEEKYKELNPEKYQDTIEHVIRKGNTPAESDGKHTSIGKEREALHSQRTEEKGTERKIKGQECKN